MKKNSDEEYKIEITEGTSVLVGILDNLEDIYLRESAKRALNRLLDFEEYQNDLMKNNISIFDKIKKIIEQKKWLSIIFYIIIIIVVFFYLFYIIESLANLKIEITSGIFFSILILLCIKSDLEIMLEKKCKKLSESITDYEHDLYLFKEDLEFLNNVLKNIKIGIRTFLIVEINNGRSIEENNHMVDVTDISTSATKEINKLKYYEIKIVEEDYQDYIPPQIVEDKNINYFFRRFNPVIYKIHVYEKICYCDVSLKINNYIYMEVEKLLKYTSDDIFVLVDDSNRELWKKYMKEKNLNQQLKLIELNENLIEQCWNEKFIEETLFINENSDKQSYFFINMCSIEDKYKPVIQRYLRSGRKYGLSLICIRHIV